MPRVSKMRVKWLVRVVIAVLLLAVVWMALILFGSSQRVEVVHPSRHNVVELVIASGRLRAKVVSNVGSEITGTVQDVLVDEGSQVRAGQTLITLERSDAQQQLDQAVLAEETARRQLAVTSRGPLPEEVARARAQLNQAQQVGRAKVESARQHLKDLQQGRAEEIRRAQAQLAQSQASRIQADQDLKRSQQLASQGAISSQDLDRAITADNEAKAVERASAQALELAKRPASGRAVAGAQADLQAAQADYVQSTKIAQDNLTLVLRGARIEDVRLAQARVSEAQAAVRLAREQLAKRIIRSPITGAVTSRTVEPGQSVTAGATLLVVTSLKNSEIYVEADEVYLPKLGVGQRAIIIPPSFPNQPFNAVVSQIGPEVNTERGVVGVRLRPVSLPDYAKPDMTVDANIEVANLPSVLSVPASAVLDEGVKSYVLVAQNGRAARRDVKILARGSEWIGVSGVSSNDLVIVNATDVTAGAKVRIARGG